MEYCDNYFDTAPSSGEISQGDWHTFFSFFIIQQVHSILVCELSVDLRVFSAQGHSFTVINMESMPNC